MFKQIILSGVVASILATGAIATGFSTAAEQMASDIGGAASSAGEEFLKMVKSAKPSTRSGTTFSNKITKNDNKSINVGVANGLIVNAQSPMALSAAHKNTATSSTELSNSITSSQDTVLGNKEAMSTAQSRGVSETDINAVNKAYGNAFNEVFRSGEGMSGDFSDIKQLMAEGGANLSAKIVSGGVQYTAQTRNGETYSVTDTSEQAQSRLEEFKESFTKQVTSSSDLNASYMNTLEKLDSEKYSDVQNAMTKMSNAEMIEDGLKAINLPLFLNNWIIEDDRFNGVPIRYAGKFALAELNKMSSNGEWEKIGYMIKKYGFIKKPIQ